MGNRVEQYVYDAPTGAEPLTIMHNGSPIDIFPPDQFWKRETAEHKIGEKRDADGNTLQVITRPRTKWVKDEVRNAAATKTGAKPDNTVWLTAGQFKAAKASKYAPNNKYLMRIRDTDQAYRKSLAERAQNHQAEIEQMKQLFEQEKQLIRDAGMKDIQEMRASFRATVGDVAKEVGVKTEDLEAALEKYRKENGKAVVAKREGRREAREILEGKPAATVTPT